MKKLIVTFFLGGLLGGALGFAVGIFVYPYIFLADIVAMEKVEGAETKRIVATGTFIHANPSDPIHYGKGAVTVYDDTLHLEGDFEVGPGPKYHVYLVLPCTISRIIRRSSEVIRPGARRAAMRSPSQTPGNAAGGLGRPPFGSRFPLPRGVGNACRWPRIARASPPAEGTGNAIVWYAKSCKGVLVPGDTVTPSSDVEKTMFVDLGRLRAFKGSQNYGIPRGVTLSGYGSVIIWCEQFGVLISPAKLDFRDT